MRTFFKSNKFSDLKANIRNRMICHYYSPDQNLYGGGYADEGSSPILGSLIAGAVQVGTAAVVANSPQRSPAFYPTNGVGTNGLPLTAGKNNSLIFLLAIGALLYFLFAAKKG